MSLQSSADARAHTPAAGNGAGERLQKVLARAGLGSRRACEALILQGRVQVNGVTVTRLGTRVDPRRDEVRVDGRIIRLGPDGQRVYLMMNKPVGVLTTMRDPRGEPSVAELLPPGLPRVFPVGRLDRDSSGLLLFTNDGELAARLLHPRYQVSKTYRVVVRGVPSRQALKTLREGVPLEDGLTAPAEVTLVKKGRSTSTLTVVLREGRKRQVRRMFQWVGHPVLQLERVAFGPLSLRGLPPGAVRPLNPREVEALRREAGLEASS